MISQGHRIDAVIAEIAKRARLESRTILAVLAVGDHQVQLLPLAQRLDRLEHNLLSWLAYDVTDKQDSNQFRTLLFGQFDEPRFPNDRDLDFSGVGEPLFTGICDVPADLGSRRIIDVVRACDDP